MTQIVPGARRSAFSRAATVAALALAVIVTATVARLLWYHVASPGALLVDAARDGRTDAVRMLLRLGVSPNQFRGRWSPALAAAWAGHTDVLRALAAHRARLDECAPYGYAPRLSPLSIAAARGHAGAVRFLVASGVPVEYECNGSGPPPVEVASEQDHAAVVALLLELGADPKRRRNGLTYVMSAAWMGAPSAIPVLVRAGCDVNAAKQDGRTAIMMTVEPEVVTALLDAGADVNARDCKGRTALYQLIEGAIWLHEHPNVSPSPYDPATLEILLQRGADPDIPSASGQTPLALAACTGPYRATIERLLVRYGATPGAGAGRR